MSAGSREDDRAVAIVGMAGRFPGARGPEELWENLRRGIETISFFSPVEAEVSTAQPAPADDPAWVGAWGVLDGVELFDASFFGFSPREAELTDPQHRLFLECCWEALEDAACTPEGVDGWIGVFAGAGVSNYWLNNVFPHQATGRGEGLVQTRIARDGDFLATRVAYKLGLRGPAVSVQAACSTSLVAVHLACQSLLAQECDAALAGGVLVRVPQRSGYLQEPGIASPDGHCRPFDAGAAGTLGGNGVGVVVLKRLADALAAGDPIRAVVRGTAVNNDGSRKAGYTAPGVEGQAEAVALAQAVAGVEAGSIGYVETHGTGTPLGDPVEVAALRRVWDDSAGEPLPCGLGSIKGNLGHLDAAAGIAGLVKTVLALEHGVLPPTVNFERLNPLIDLAGSAFYVVSEAAEWPGPGPRRAGVSAFGVGGTNVHLVVEEAPPPRRRSRPEREWQVLVLSARSPGALERSGTALAAHLRRRPQDDLADVAYTLATGRRGFEHRRAVVCRGREEACRLLEGEAGAGTWTSRVDGSPPRVGFLFPGLGEHYPGMARGLYDTEPRFREELDRCAELLRPHLGCDLRDQLYPAATPGPERGSAGPDLRRMLGRRSATADEAAGPVGGGGLSPTGIAQPVVFALEYALARLWMAWGVEPEAMAGFSVGEYVAACLAGVFPLESALELVAARARLIDALPAGAMLALPLPEEEARELAGEELSLAAVGGPANSVLAGPAAAVAALEERLLAEGVACRRLATAHAFHSRMMEPIAGAFAEVVAGFGPRPPERPFLSNVTGTWITPQQATDPGYWSRHLVATVRFGDALAQLWQEPDRVLLEVGPGQALSSLALQHPGAGGAGARTVVASGRHAYDPQPDRAFLLTAVSKLWLAGVEPDWEAVFDGGGRPRLRLPTYPFERRRCWIDPPASGGRGRDRPSDDFMTPRSDPGEWFYFQSWRRSPAPSPWEAGDLGSAAWLVLGAADRLSSGLVAALRRCGNRVLEAEPGAAYESLPGGAFRLDPGEPEDYERLLDERLLDGLSPAETGAAGAGASRRIVHLWCAGAASAGDGEPADALVRGCLSLLYLARALARRAVGDAVQLWVVTRGLHPVEEGDEPAPARAALLGPLKVIPQEYPNLVCRNVDLAGAAPDAEVELLLSELAAGSPDAVVAYRGGRWVEGFEPGSLPDRPGRPRRLRPRGVYLITGGLGRIGGMIAAFLARAAGARLVLTGRSGLPPRERWPEVAAAGGRLARRVEQVRDLEALGAEVEVVAADAGDEEAMAAALRLARRGFGGLDGVIHAAGVVDREHFHPIPETGRAEVEIHLRPKAEGAEVLARLLRNGEPGGGPDFVLLVSSISTVLGGLEFAAYAAANAYLDAVARRESRRGPIPWTSVDWGEALEPAEVEQALRRLFWAGPVDRVVLTPTDLSARLKRWVGPGRLALRGGGEGAAPAGATVRRAAEAPFVAPAEPAQERIAEIWRELLGVERVGLHDDFFALGGDSLVATQLVFRLRAGFGVDVSLRAVFQAPTVAGLAEHVEDLLITEIEGMEAAPEAAAPEPVETTGQAAVPAPLPCTLPNGLEILCRTRTEALHFYHDIFEQEVYRRHGVELPPGAVVFDVGANIGLFTVWVHRRCPGARLWAFEPAPPLFTLLEANAARAGVDARLFPCGLADRPGTATLTFYPLSSGMSSLRPDLDEERAVLEALMESRRRQGLRGMEELMELSEDLLAERLRSVPFEVRLKTLSQVLAEAEVGVVDLVKIDVQKSELAVLDGIGDDDWPRIRQIVAEVHDLDGGLAAFTGRLEARGFEVAVEQDDPLRGTVLHNVYAVRPARSGTSSSSRRRRGEREPARGAASASRPTTTSSSPMPRSGPTPRNRPRLPASGPPAASSGTKRRSARGPAAR